MLVFFVFADGLVTTITTGTSASLAQEGDSKIRKARFAPD